MWPPAPMMRTARFGGSGSQASPLISAPTLPAGVTLQAIDGETMTSPTTMSHNYYARNGWVQAASNTYTGKSWDDPTFFPIMSWYGGYFSSTGDVTTYQSYGLNVTQRMTSNSALTLAQMRTTGLWLVEGTDSTATLENGTPGTETGILNMDEPNPSTEINTAIAGVPNAVQDSRAWWVNWTWNQIANNNVGGTAMATFVQTDYPTPNATTRKVNITSVDWYFFSGAPIPAQGTNAGTWYGTADLTQDQNQRGIHYGNMIDVMRAWYSPGGGPSTSPVFLFLEAIDGLSGPGSAVITPTQMNWMVWAQLLHGSRSLLWFPQGANSNTGEGLWFDTTGLFTANKAQGIAINTLVNQLAPVLNSPFALSYVGIDAGSSAPLRYKFPTAAINFNNGIDICAKWYQGGNVTNAGLALVNGFYIFACTGYSETVTSISATFTVASGTVANVVNESRSINIVGGKFTDTFATGATVHIYQIS